MDEMIKIILASIFGGTAFGSLALYLVQKRFNKKKDDIELAVEYQDFYRKEIAAREEDKEKQRIEISKLNEKIDKMSSQLEVVISQNKEYIEEIDHNRINLLKHENEISRQVDVIKQKDNVISRLEGENEELRG